MSAFNIEALEDAQAAVRHYGMDFGRCGRLTEQGLADHVYLYGGTRMDARGFARGVESYMDQGELYQWADARAALAGFIRELRAEPDGASAWTALAELATLPSPAECTQDRDIRPQLPGVLRILQRLKDFEPFFRESLSLDYVPGELGLADGLLRADFEMLDATLLQVPRRSREVNVFLELAALLRLLADEESRLRSFEHTAA